MSEPPMYTELHVIAPSLVRDSPRRQPSAPPPLPLPATTTSGFPDARELGMYIQRGRMKRSRDDELSDNDYVRALVEKTRIEAELKEAVNKVARVGLLLAAKRMMRTKEMSTECPTDVPEHAQRLVVGELDGYKLTVYPSSSTHESGRRVLSLSV